MSKKIILKGDLEKNELNLHSSSAEYLTYIAATSNNEYSMEMRYEYENI